MNSHFTISDQELNSGEWAKARAMCQRYGYDIHEIAAGIARFRMLRAEARAQALREQAVNQPVTSASAPATLVHFTQVRQYWDAKHQRWTKPGIVYIGRAMPALNFELPASPYGNPFRLEKDSDEARTDAIELYLNWIQLPAQAHLLRQLDSLRGKMLVCWCHPRRCHGDVLIELMRSKPSYADVQPEPKDYPINEGTAAWQPTFNIDAF